MAQVSLSDMMKGEDTTDSKTRRQDYLISGQSHFNRSLGLFPESPQIKSNNLSY